MKKIALFILLPLSLTAFAFAEDNNSKEGDKGFKELCGTFGAPSFFLNVNSGEFSENSGNFNKPSFEVSSGTGTFSKPSADFGKPSASFKPKDGDKLSQPSFSLSKDNGQLSKPSFSLTKDSGQFSKPSFSLSSGGIFSSAR